MAQKIEVVLVDDLDGSKADETVTFAVDGARYEIDLNAEHASQLREQFERWAAAGRRVGAKAKRRNLDVRKIRLWAQAQGYEVSERGRMSQQIIDAYRESHEA